MRIMFPASNPPPPYNNRQQLGMQNRSTTSADLEGADSTAIATTTTPTASYHSRILHV